MAKQWAQAGYDTCQWKFRISGTPWSPESTGTDNSSATDGSALSPQRSIQRYENLLHLHDENLSALAASLNSSYTVPCDIYINNQSLTVDVLIDTGALHNNYIDLNTAAWIQARLAELSAEENLDADRIKATIPVITVTDNNNTKASPCCLNCMHNTNMHNKHLFPVGVNELSNITQSDQLAPSPKAVKGPNGKRTQNNNSTHNNKVTRVCTGVKGMCSNTLGQVTFDLEIKDPHGSEPTELTAISAQILDTPYQLILGRPDIIKYDLLQVLQSHFTIEEAASKGDLRKHSQDNSSHTATCTMSHRKASHVHGHVPPELSVLIKKNELLDSITDDDGIEYGEDDDLPWEIDDTDVKEKPSSKGSAPLIEGPTTLQEKLHALLGEFNDIFSAELKPTPAKLTPMEIRVDTARWQSNKNRLPPRTQTRAKEEEIKRQINNMLAQKVIKPSQSAYYSQVQLTPKPNDKWRFCIDYRGLNECSNAMGWPIPNVSKMLQRLGHKRAKFYAVMDLTSGYHQAPLSMASQAASAFITFMGVYEWLRVPMGLKGAPSHFQQKMATEVLCELMYNSCESYLDDIIVFGRTEKEFSDNLTEVFKRFRKHGLTLNPAKCRFGLSEVEYVGHIINEHGLSFSQAKRDEVLDFPKPKTYKNMKQFLGLINYFRDHVENHSIITQPLQNLIEGKYDKNKVLKWTPELDATFDEVKRVVSKCPSLSFMDAKLPIFLQTDASDYGIGAYLFQYDKDAELRDKNAKVDKPIAFISKSLTKEKLNWSVPEKEAYAIYYALQKLEYLVRDVYFVLRTDHKNLTYINSEGSAKVRRWKLAIQEYNFDIEHIAGEDNLVADAFSRLCIREDEGDAPERLLNKDEDPLPRQRYQQIKKVHNSTAGHNGVEKTLQKLSAAGIEAWPNARKHIREFIQKCPVCQKLSERAVKVYTEPYTTAELEPMHTLNIDAIGPLPEDEFGNKHILVVVCCFTRFVELYSIPDTTAVVAAKCLLQHVGRYGTPQRIRSDNGSQNVNEVIKEFFELIGTEHQLTLAYSKEENAIVERANKEVMRHLRAILIEKNTHNQWSTYLPLVQRIMNASEHSAIGFSPAQLLFGNAITLDRGIFLPMHSHGYKGARINKEQQLSDWSDKMLKEQARLIELARKAQELTNGKHMKEASANRTEYPINSYVLVKYRDRPPSKFHTHWAGPMRVVHASKSTYTLQNLVNDKLVNYHLSQLKPFVYDEMEVDPVDIARREQEEFLVEKILSHKGTYEDRSNMQFEVKWLGYDDSHITWEPWKHMRENIEVHKYLYNLPNKKYRRLLAPEQKTEVIRQINLALGV